MSKSDKELAALLEKIAKDKEQKQRQEQHQLDTNIYQDPQKNKQEINYTKTNNQLLLVTDQSHGDKFKFLLNRFFGLLRSIHWRMVVNGILVIFGILIVIEIIMNLEIILAFLWECFIALVIIGVLFSLFR